MQPPKAKTFSYVYAQKILSLSSLALKAILEEFLKNFTKQVHIYLLYWKKISSAVKQIQQKFIHKLSALTLTTKLNKNH